MFLSTKHLRRGVAGAAFIGASIAGAAIATEPNGPVTVHRPTFQRSAQRHPAARGRRRAAVPARGVSMAWLHVGHMSGRFNAPSDQVVAYIVKLLNYRHLDALTTTESEEPNLGPAVRAALGPGFHVVKRHEYMVITRNATLRPVPGSATYRQLSSNIHGAEAWRNMFSASAAYRVIGTDKEVIFYATHAPATIDMSDPTYRPGITGPKIASRRGFRALGKWIASRARPNVVQLSDMDSNVDWHNPMWRETVLAETGGTSIWSAARPAAGTHSHDRLIDCAIVYNATVRASIISPANAYRPAALDHKTIEYWVAFARR